MHVIRAVAGFVLIALVLTACQDRPGGSADAPRESPIAPAVEPSHPDDEQTIPIPTSSAPVAPAIEPEHPDAERTIPLPSQPE
jgi:hypothetical protein